MSHVVIIGSPPFGVKRTVEESGVYWVTHASENRKAALRRNWDTINCEKLASLSPNDAFIIRYVADGPKYWYDYNYDASPLWRNMHLNMDAVNAFRGLFTEHELSWDPASLKAPVLVAIGRYDYVVPHVLWEEILPNLQNVTYRLFEPSGHTPQLEEQKLFDKLLLEFLGKASAPGTI